MTMLARKLKSNIAQSFVGVLSRDKLQRPKALVVPGSKGKQYRVILRRYKDAITGECQLLIGKSYVPCQGNSRTICYHVRAAIDYSISEAGLKVAWCDTEPDALRLSHTLKDKWKITKVKSRDSGRTMWLLVHG